MKEVLPYISICISVVSLGIALYVMFRDRTRFDVSGSYKESFANMVDGIYIKVVNSGRRPITLYALVFVNDDGKPHKFRITKSIGERVESAFESRDLSNPCLAESQFFEFLLDTTNFDFCPINFASLASIKIESSTGASKEIPGLASEVKTNAHYLKPL
jgi:hypothetical protein